ncbi:MAG: sigma-70 family RNA polymerase sigma factor [Deltaproteobacteria bacterium]|nr:sigma-70 family RNA polymerase sigma factor [Deltaproteobacteria bacterium]
MSEPLLHHSFSQVEAEHNARFVRDVIDKAPGAAARLWDRFAPQVRRVIRRSMARDDVEDLVQEVFLRVFHRLHRLREPQALAAFILTVTASVVASEMRRRKVRRFLWLTKEGELPEPASAPLDHDAREALLRLYDVLHRSSHEERMSFVLKHMEGMELADVAHALELSVATVKRRLQKVNARLARAVHEDPVLLATLGLQPTQKAAP